MYEIHASVLLTIDGEEDTGQQKVSLDLVGYVPFPVTEGMKIEADIPDSPLLGVMQITSAVWKLGPGGSGYFDVQGRVPLDEPALILPADFADAFRHFGWSVD